MATDIQASSSSSTTTTTTAFKKRRLFDRERSFAAAEEMKHLNSLMMAYNIFCPLPPLSEFLQLPFDDLKRFAPRLDLQRFCELVEYLGDKGHLLTYPFFESFTITQTYEGKFETIKNDIFGFIQFPEKYLEQFEFCGGLNIIADSLWGIPTNMDKIKKLPHAPFSLYLKISRRESFQNKFKCFQYFDAIFLEIDQLNNHSICFSELLDLAKNTSTLSLSINKSPGDIPNYFAEQLLGWDRPNELEDFALSGAPENFNLQALCHFVKYKCKSPERVFIDFRVFNLQSFKKRFDAFKNSVNGEDLNFVIYVNGRPF